MKPRCVDESEVKPGEEDTMLEVVTKELTEPSAEEPDAMAWGGLERYGR